MSLCRTCDSVVFGRIDKTTNEVYLVLKNTVDQTIDAELLIYVSNTVI